MAVVVGVLRFFFSVKKKVTVKNLKNAKKVTMKDSCYLYRVSSNSTLTEIDACGKFKQFCLQK